MLVVRSLSLCILGRLAGSFVVVVVWRVGGGGCEIFLGLACFGCNLLEWSRAYQRWFSVLDSPDDAIRFVS